VGFDTPETSKGGCPSEIEKGNRATARLISLLESKDIDLTEVPCSCCPRTFLTKECNAGRRCGRLTVDGKDVGEILIAEGLAVPFKCDATSCPSNRVGANIRRKAGPRNRSAEPPRPKSQYASHLNVKALRRVREIQQQGGTQPPFQIKVR
jgi:endonuclease YncB( thermonuclease family)